MDKNLSFNWVTFFSNIIENNQNYTNIQIVNNYAFSKINLLQIIKTVKDTKKYRYKKALSEIDQNYDIFINGLTNPIKFINTSKIKNSNFTYTILDEGPSVQWLLDNKKNINNPNPDKLIYTDNTVAYFKSFYDKTTIITFLKIKNIKHILKIEKNIIVGWLGYKTFNTFLKSYGYVNKEKNEDLIFILIIYKAAKKLEFKNPEKAIAPFCNKQLIAELKLKGVFEVI